MKTKLIFTSACLLLMSAMSYAQSVGGKKDKHGCLTSAGYTFSILKNDCVKLFEEKIKLDEVNPKKSYTSFAAVIFSDDQKKAEVFLPGLKSSLILVRTGTKGKYIWRRGNLALSNQNGYELKRGNALIYKAK
eukprot:gene14651-17328_t